MSLSRKNEHCGIFGPHRRAVVAALLLACIANIVSAQDEKPGPGAPAFEPYPDVPEFTVRPRKDKLFFYPCSQCHDFMEPSGEVRELMAPHEIELTHGRGRLWCVTCHVLEGRDYLTTFLDQPVDFDDAYLICGGCHADKQRDWFFGAHGKRVGDWLGPRVLYNCTECHDAHSPAISARAPQPPPPVRAGLEREIGEVHRPHQPWERIVGEERPENSDEH